MSLLCKVRFEEAFKDGSIFPRAFRVGEIVDDLPEEIVQRIRQSGGLLEILEKRVPPSTVENPEPPVTTSTFVDNVQTLEAKEPAVRPEWLQKTEVPEPLAENEPAPTPPIAEPLEPALPEPEPEPETKLELVEVPEPEPEPEPVKEKGKKRGTKN